MAAGSNIMLDLNVHYTVFYKISILYSFNQTSGKRNFRGIQLVPGTQSVRVRYPSNRVGTANPVSVRVRVMVSASLSSAAVESLVLIESQF